MAGRKCPTCRNPLDEGAAAGPYHPFCSARCRSADLGNWLNASYRICAPVSEEDLDSGLPTGTPADSDGDDPDMN
ncbi:MAG TPA: DNA gyrase inhibitor YacG [Polyangia bacterium]|nr:DNA gyrase inhibitor YacG [Polyangia bacterium]